MVSTRDYWDHVYTYVFDDHNQKRQFDAKSLLRVGRALNECGADVGSHNLKYRGLDIRIGNTLDVTISNCNEKSRYWVSDFQKHMFRG